MKENLYRKCEIKNIRFLLFVHGKNFKKHTQKSRHKVIQFQYSHRVSEATDMATEDRKLFVIKIRDLKARVVIVNKKYLPK